MSAVFEEELRLDNGDSVGIVAGASCGDAVDEGVMGLETELGLAVSNFSGGRGKTVLLQRLRCIAERGLYDSDAYVGARAVCGDTLHASFRPRELPDGILKLDLGRQGIDVTDAVVETWSRVSCVVIDEISMVSPFFLRCG